MSETNRFDALSTGELLAGARPGPRPGAFLVEVTEEEIAKHENDTRATADIVLTLHHTARFRSEAIVGGFAQPEDVRAFLDLAVRATDRQPKACFADAENFAFKLSRGMRAKERQP